MLIRSRKRAWICCYALALVLGGTYRAPAHSQYMGPPEWVKSCRSIHSPGDDSQRKYILAMFGMLDFKANESIRVCFNETQPVLALLAEHEDGYIDIAINNKRLVEIEQRESTLSEVANVIVAISYASQWSWPISDDDHVANNRAAFYDAGEITAQILRDGQFRFSSADAERLVTLYMTSGQREARDGAPLFDRGWREGRAFAEKKRAKSKPTQTKPTSKTNPEPPASLVAHPPSKPSPKPQQIAPSDPLDTALRWVGIDPRYANAFERGWAMLVALFGVVLLPVTVWRILRRRSKRRAARAAA